MSSTEQRAGSATLRERLHCMIFESDTPAGKAFDVVLLVLILLSVIAVMLETIPGLEELHRETLISIEWALTLLFTVEYLLRLYCVERRGAYARSFFGIIDLASLLPTWLSLVVPGAHSLQTIRVLRLVRVFRVLKLARYVSESRVLTDALRASRPKITVFVLVFVCVVTVISSLMYLVEPPESGFTSIPTGMYWAIVTLTTVGYGDITPVTPIGKVLASIVMILGYGIIAVPTGIVTAELTSAANPNRRRLDGRACHGCGADDHRPDAAFCRHCGHALD